MFTNEYTIHGSVHLTPPTPLGKNDEFAHVPTFVTVCITVSVLLLLAPMMFIFLTYTMYILPIALMGPKKGFALYSMIDHCYQQRL